MLYDLGGVAFDIVGINTDRVTKNRETSFAEYDVMGSSILYEHTGNKDRKITLTGKVHPFHFGGLPALAALETIRESGQPVFLQRGDGIPMGWVLIDSIEEEDAYIQYGGTPGQVSHKISLLRCDAPGVGGLANLLYTLF